MSVSFLREAEDLAVLCAALVDRKVSQERCWVNTSGSWAGCDQVAAEEAVRNSFMGCLWQYKGQESVFLPAYLPVNVATRQEPMKCCQRHRVQFCQHSWVQTNPPFLASPCFVLSPRRWGQGRAAGDGRARGREFPVSFYLSSAPEPGIALLLLCSQNSFPEWQKGGEQNQPGVF